MFEITRSPAPENRSKPSANIISLLELLKPFGFEGHVVSTTSNSSTQRREQVWAESEHQGNWIEEGAPSWRACQKKDPEDGGSFHMDVASLPEDTCCTLPVSNAERFWRFGCAPCVVTFLAVAGVLFVFGLYILGAVILGLLLTCVSVSFYIKRTTTVANAAVQKPYHQLKSEARNATTAEPAADSRQGKQLTVAFTRLPQGFFVPIMGIQTSNYNQVKPYYDEEVEDSLRAAVQSRGCLDSFLLLHTHITRASNGAVFVFRNSGIQVQATEERFCEMRETLALGSCSSRECDKFVSKEVEALSHFARKVKEANRDAPFLLMYLTSLPQNLNIAVGKLIYTGMTYAEGLEMAAIMTTQAQQADNDASNCIQKRRLDVLQRAERIKLEAYDGCIDCDADVYSEQCWGRVEHFMDVVWTLGTSRRIGQVLFTKCADLDRDPDFEYDQTYMLTTAEKAIPAKVIFKFLLSCALVNKAVSQLLAGSHDAPGNSQLSLLPVVLARKERAQGNPRRLPSIA
ncbi:hypothetical protein CYMTET_4425 [Cymbomonas tetramitiformis]|uniref:Uncharacterized protein n=1 Tax=Cymbomonas tetramitiformis TaxID=36881 RepID=A0AAE0CC82_9CHLO|nr:hypothetical protein CYMTET_39402 [Cymbomonas tetramitiformis]KAK3288088.1 hypothetical protein CYMTET_4425 [Cymbomonas tetramitiformis]